MTTASFNHRALPLVAFLLLFNSVDASSKTRKLLTVAAPEVPVVDNTCALSTVEGDTVTFTNPEVQITKGSAIFMGRVDSCFGWQVGGNEQGEFRTQLLCGGGKPAADQFCRGNDFSMAGSFQISTAYLDFTYSISDFKICYDDSCLGFDSIECQTCQSDVDGESAPDSGSDSQVSAASVESSEDMSPMGAPAPGPGAASSDIGHASVFVINGSSFCYNNGYGNVGCYNVGNNNIGDRNNGDFNVGNNNNGTGNTGNFNQGVNNTGEFNRGMYNNGTGNDGTFNMGVNNTGNFNRGINNNGDANQGTYNAGQVNLGNHNNGIGNSGNGNNGTWNAGNLNLGNNNGGSNNEGDNNRGDGLLGNNLSGLVRAPAPSS